MRPAPRRGAARKTRPVPNTSRAQNAVRTRRGARPASNAARVRCAKSAQFDQVLVKWKTALLRYMGKRPSFAPLHTKCLDLQYFSRSARQSWRKPNGWCPVSICREVMSMEAVVRVMGVGSLGLVTAPLFPVSSGHHVLFRGVSHYADDTCLGGLDSCWVVPQSSTAWETASA